MHVSGKAKVSQTILASRPCGGSSQYGKGSNNDTKADSAAAVRHLQHQKIMQLQI
jgi:hypothetical protein